MLQRPKFGYDPTSRRFAMAVGTQSVRLWKLTELQKQQQEASGRVDTDRSAIKGVMVTPQQLVTVHETGLVIGWELDEDDQTVDTQRWSLDTGMVVSEVAHRHVDSRDELLVAIGGVSGEVVVCRIGDEPPQRAEPVKRHDDQVEVLQFSSDGQRLATAGRDRLIAVWELEESNQTDVVPLQLIRRLEGSGGWPLSVAFSSDGRRIVSGCMDNGVYLWDLDAGQPRSNVRFDHHGWVEDVAWAGDDDVIVTAGWDNFIGVYDGTTMSPRFQFTYHDDYVVRLQAVSDTTRVFAASYDGEVTVWDWEKGRLEAILEGHTDWVTGLVQLDDDLVASLSSDQTARLWSIDDLSEVTRLGEAVLEGFELGGEMDLASFGLSEDSPHQIEDQTGPELQQLQPKVVRRLKSDAPRVSAGGQDTAMSMLEQAVDLSVDVQADVVEPDGSTVEDGGGLDDLSSMVQEAISDVEETDTSGPVESPRDIDGDEETNDGAVDLLDVPQMETATAADLDGDDAADREDDTNVDVDDEQNGDDHEADAVEAFAERDIDNLDGDEVDDANELTDEAFDALEEGVGIMDSMFDTDQPGESNDKRTRADGDIEGLGEESSVPTSGPDYDPRPVESDDEVADLLPDEDEFELAFSSSVAEEVDSGGGDVDAEDDSDDGQADERDERNVDCPGDDEDEGPDQREDSEGKFKPPSATGNHQPKADGGDSTSDRRDRRAEKLTTKSKTVPGAPLQPPPGRDESAPESPSDDAPGGQVHQKPTGRKRRKTATPFTNGQRDEDAQPSDSPSGGDEKSTGRSLLDRLAKNLEKKEESGAVNQQNTGEAKTDEESEDEQTAIDELGGVDDGIDQDTDDVDAESVAIQDRQGGEPSHEETNQAQEQPEDSPGALDSRGPSSAMLEPGEQSETEVSPDQLVDPQDESTDRSPGLKAGDRRQMKFDGEPTSAAANSEVKSIGGGDTQSRLMPGESVDREELNIPEPDEPAEAGAGQTRATMLDDVDWPQLWERGCNSAPMMGILKRHGSSEADYQPKSRLETGHPEPVVMALSSKYRLVTTGADGTVGVWNQQGESIRRFNWPDRRWVDVGFIDGERFLYGLDRDGTIELWLLPEELDDDEARLQRANAGAEGLAYRCGAIDDNGEFLLVGSEQGTTYLWRLEQPECVARLQGHEAGICAVAFGERGPITAGLDRTIRCWNDRGMQIDLIDTTDEIRDLEARSGTFVWVEASGAIRRSREGSSDIDKLQGHFGEGKAVAAVSDDTWVTGGEDGRILVYHRDSDEPGQEIQVPAPVNRLVASDKILVATSPGGVVYIFERSS